MNIFALDLDPRIAASMHCDKHVTKMSVEYAQLLSSAHHRWQSPYAALLYKATHQRHPSTLWAGDHPDHYDWLYALACATWDEYTHRYGKLHGSSRLRDLLLQRPLCSGRTVAVPPPQCMPDACKTIGNTWENAIDGYRRYYRVVKYSFATWKNRPQPEWFVATRT